MGSKHVEFTVYSVKRYEVYSIWKIHLKRVNNSNFYKYKTVVTINRYPFKK